VFPVKFCCRGLDDEKTFLRDLYTFLDFSLERLPDTSIDFIKQLIPPVLKLINQQLSLFENPEPGETPQNPLLLSIKDDYEKLQDLIREISGETRKAEPETDEASSASSIKKRRRGRAPG